MTNAELAWEIFKGVGSMAGLVTGAFIIWDRLWRHVPQAVVVPRRLMEGSVNIVARLAIKNLAMRPILLSWENGASGHLRLAKDDSVGGVVNSLFGGRKTIVIDVGASRELEIMRPYNFDEIAPDDWLHLTLQWKFAQPIWWQPERKIRVALKKGDFALLSGAGDDQDNAM